MMPSRERDVAVSKTRALTESRVAWAVRTRLRVAKPSQMGWTSLVDTLPTLSHWSSTSSPREVVSLRTPTPMEPLTSTRGPKPACALLTSCSRAERFSLMLIRLRWLLKTPWTVSFTVMCARVLPGRTSSFAQALPALQTSKQARATAAGIHFFRSAIIPPP